MCGIVGAVSTFPVNQLLYDSLLLLQHRGQDAAGIATAKGRAFYMHKASGMVLAHNGNLTNSAQLKEALFRIDRRRLNTQSDSEVLLNVLAHELQQSSA